MPEKVDKPRRPWTKEEDHILSSSIAQYGSKRGPVTESRWSEISRRLPGRTNKVQIAESAGFTRSILHCEKEDRFLIANVSRIGHRWAMMSAALPGRPPLTCRNRYRALEANGKNAQRCMRNTSNSPSSESSTTVACDDSRTVTGTDNQTVCDRPEELTLALPETEETSLPDTFDHYQSPQYECLQHIMPDWMSPNMGFSPLTDQHLDIWDDVSMDNMIKSGVDIGLEDLDFELRSNLSGTGSITGSQVSDGNISLGSSGQQFSGFEAHAINPQFHNKVVSWETTDGQSWSSQAGFESSNQQLSSGPRHVLHVVHHHHVYHHHTHHASS